MPPLTVLSLLCAAVSMVRGHGSEIHSLPHRAVLDAAGKFHVAWNYNSSDIVFRVTAETRGYVALGFSPNGGMAGSDIVIGWVEDGTGVVSLQDRYAKGEYEPQMKTKPISRLLSGTQNSSHTIITFIRPLNLCPHEGFKITEDTVRLIWAFNYAEPSGGRSLLYHGDNRGVKSIFLLNPNKSPPPLPDNIVTVDFLMKDVLIPHHKDTTYWCQSFEVPTFGRKHHLIQSEPIIVPGREAEVHHIVMSACRHQNASSVNVSHECYHPNMPPEWLGCSSQIMAWAIGGGVFSFPEHVGLPLGEQDGVTLIILEVHYDNPRLKSGMRDSSGLRFTFTPDLRQYDAGLMDMGVIVGDSHVIPPYYDAFLSEGLCGKSCISQGMGNLTDSINIFAVFLHSHLAGRQLRLRHYRNGVEKKIIAEDNNYDFNLQEYRILPKEVVLNKGDETVTQCVYNTADRTSMTYGGLGTKQEMCIAFVMYYPKIPLSICATRPLAQYNVGFIGATANEQGVITSPPKHQGKRWTEIFQQEIDWTSKQTRDRFQEFSLRKNVVAHLSMCYDPAIRFKDPYDVAAMPSVFVPLPVVDTCPIASTANRPTSPYYSVGVIAAFGMLLRR